MDKETQLAAVNRDGGAIEYIDDPDKDVQIAAIRTGRKSTIFDGDEYRELEMSIINYIKNPDKDVQLELIKAHICSVGIIENLDKSIFNEFNICKVNLVDINTVSSVKNIKLFIEYYIHGCNSLDDLIDYLEFCKLYNNKRYNNLFDEFIEYGKCVKKST